MQRKKTTSEIIDRLGMNQPALIVYLTRHPDLRPAERLPNDDYFWDEHEIQRLIEARKKRRKIAKSQ